MTVVTTTDVSSRSYVEWGAVVAGTVLALALSAVLFQFGSAIGLAAAAPLRGEGYIGSLGVIATGIYLLWVQLLSSLAGGYLAGYVRRPSRESAAGEREMRDGGHGLLSWALATVVMAAVAAAASAIGSVAPDTSAVAELTEEAERIQRNSGVIFAFVVAASSVVSAVAAWWAGTQGGENRDEGVDYSRHISFRKK